ncbi:hypothetical protein ACNPM4_13100, partial [Microbacterium sp. AGC62]
PRGATRNMMNDIRGARRLIAEVASFAPTVIYARWLAPVPGLYRGLSAVAPVVVEVHADDLVEVARSSWTRRTYLRLFRAQELRQASGGTFVVSELADDRSFRLIRGARGVFGNGSWVQRRAQTSSGRPRVGISTAAMNDWTGLDRFAALASELGDLSDWIVVCPASERHTIAAAMGDAVQVVGTRDQTEYLDEVASWSVAMGTLALERKSLRTASPLKVRDYLGLGVPTVLPYWDEGIADLENDLLLKLAGPNDAPVEHIDSALIRDFIVRAHGRDLPAEVSSHASGVEIERRRVDFLGQFPNL